MVLVGETVICCPLVSVAGSVASIGFAVNVALPLANVTVSLADCPIEMFGVSTTIDAVGAGTTFTSAVVVARSPTGLVTCRV